MEGLDLYLESDDGARRREEEEEVALGRDGEGEEWWEMRKKLEESLRESEAGGWRTWFISWLE